MPLRRYSWEIKTLHDLSWQEFCPKLKITDGQFVTISVRSRGGCMASENHIASLKDKHHELEVAIQDENNRPLPDEMHIQELKRQKLRIKEEIIRMSGH
jgi:hypothetical protein